MCSPSVLAQKGGSIECSSSAVHSHKEEKRKRHNGVLYGSISVFISFVGAAITFPFLQAKRDELGCDALCYGTMQSARSGLVLVGAFLVGRLSDRYGRHSALLTGIVSTMLSYMLSWRCSSITEMWVALVPSSLLNQNFTVLKALFAEYIDENGGTESERASALGRLGMAVGMGFMFGPVLGTTLLANYDQAILVALVLTILSSLLMLPSFLPIPIKTTQPRIQTEKGNKFNLLAILSLPAARTNGAQLLMFMKLMMSVAFAIFMTVWTVSVRARFAFGPKEHAFFMCWVGMWYALSQGVLARWLIRLSGEDPTVVLLACVTWLGLGRVFAMMTSSLVVVYVTMALVIVALGIVNTATSSAVSHLADADQVGGLFGLLETIESLGGIVGPVLGGLLHRCHPHAPLTTVVAIYCLLLLVLWRNYRTSIVLHVPSDYSPSGKERGSTGGGTGGSTGGTTGGWKGTAERRFSSAQATNEPSCESVGDKLKAS